MTTLLDAPAGNGRANGFQFNDADRDEPPRDMTITDKVCARQGCDALVVKTGEDRRAPKYCPEHRGPVKQPAPSGAGPRTGPATRRASWSEAETVEQALVTYLSGAGTLLGFVNTVDGQIVTAQAQPLAHELTELGRKDRQFRKWLEAVTKPGKYGPLAMVLVMGIVLPIAMNHGLVPMSLFTAPTPTSADGGSLNGN